MYHLAYVSSATEPFSDERLEELLDKSRLKNHRLGITGMLVYNDGVFIQILEGKKEAVVNLFNTIESDSRHRGITLIDESILEQRQFKEWSMAFKVRYGKEFFTQEEIDQDSTGYLQMLQSFVKNSLR